MKKILVSIMLVGLIFALSIVVLAEEEKTYPRGNTVRTKPLLNDEAGLVDPEFGEAMGRELAELSKRHLVDIAVVTVTSLDGKEAMQYAMEYFNEYGMGFGADDDGVLLLLCPEERDFAVITHNYARYAISDSEKGPDRLMRDVLKALKKDDYEKAIKTYAVTAARMLELARQNKRYTEGSTLYPEQNRLYGTPIFGAIFAVIGGFIKIRKEKDKLGKIKPKEDIVYYIPPASVAVQNLSEVLVDVKESRRKIYVQSSSSSSHSSSSSSSHSSGSRSFGGTSGKY